MFHSDKNFIIGEMGEYSKDCESWLPSQFLTDDEILMGFKSTTKVEQNKSKKYFGCDFQNEFSYGFNMFSPNSPVESVVESTETESDEEDYIIELARQMAHSTLENHKTWGLSNSPQSTLCDEKSKKGAVDLLYAAAGEVARMKKMEEEARFCHDKIGMWGPTMKKACPNLGSFYSSQPPVSYQQLQMAQFQRLKQQERMKQRQGMLGHNKDGFWQYQMSQNHQLLNQGREKNCADRPLNLLKSAWPTVQQSQQQQQNQAGSGMRAVLLGNTGPKRECAGTGVFIPRTQTETRKKQGCSTVLIPDRVVQALNLNLDAMDSRPQPQVQPKYNNGHILKYQNNVLDQQRRNLRTQPVAMSQEIMLPQEWTY